MRDIDMILPPIQQPQPEDPGIENSKALQMQGLQAFAGQAHMAHIEAHRAFMSSFLVANNPPTMGILQAHISQHISLMAREEVEAKNAQIIQEQAQQFGGQIPPELLAQFQQQNEREIAEKITELTNMMDEEEQNMMNMDKKDPLIDLKQQELLLRAQQLQQDRDLSEKRLDLDTEKLNFEGQKLQQKDDMDKERLQSQEYQAELRAEVTLAGQRRQK